MYPSQDTPQTSISSHSRSLASAGVRQRQSSEDRAGSPAEQWADAEQQLDYAECLQRSAVREAAGDTEELLRALYALVEHMCVSGVTTLEPADADLLDRVERQLYPGRETQP
jgi:hypothetical protein